MVENRKDPQGQGNQKGQNPGQQNPNERKEGNPSERKNTPETEDEDEGTKMPGRETRTPVAEDEKRKQEQGNQGNRGSEQERGKDDPTRRNM